MKGQRQRTSVSVRVERGVCWCSTVLKPDAGHTSRRLISEKNEGLKKERPFPI